MYSAAESVVVLRLAVNIINDVAVSIQAIVQLSGGPQQPGGGGGGGGAKIAL